MRRIPVGDPREYRCGWVDYEREQAGPGLPQKDWREEWGATMTTGLRARLVDALRKLDYETTGGDLSARSSTGPEQWADVLLSSLPDERWLKEPTPPALDFASHGRINRVELVDHRPARISPVEGTPHDRGRVYTAHEVENVVLSIQDDGRTLKVFLS